MKDIWKLREHIAEALLHDGDGCFKVTSSFMVHIDIKFFFSGCLLVYFHSIIGLKYPYF